MKDVQLSRKFNKQFAKRIARNDKLQDAFEYRLALWRSGQRSYPVNDHALTGSLAGKRAFSIANDLRFVYEETDEAYIFLDIGSHAQVYDQ